MIYELDQILNNSLTTNLFLTGSTIALLLAAVVGLWISKPKTVRRGFEERAGASWPAARNPLL